MLNDVNNVSTLEPLMFELTFRRNDRNVKYCQFGVLARNESDSLVWANYSLVTEIFSDKDEMKVKLTIPNHNSPKGKYTLNFNISRYDYSAIIRDYDIVFDAISFQVTYLDKEHSHPFSIWPFRSGCSLHESIVKVL